MLQNLYTFDFMHDNSQEKCVPLFHALVEDAIKGTVTKQVMKILSMKARVCEKNLEHYRLFEAVGVPFETIKIFKY